jgi:chromosome segregation ATPase
MALAFPSAVQAQGTNPPPPPGGQNQVERLEKAYQRELKALDAQVKRLTAVDERVQKVTERIANLKSQGKDTTALDEALNDFKAAVQEAHTSHDSAAAILKTHAGFDANGKVTDAQQARATVKEAEQLLRRVHQGLRPAIRDVVRAVREFIRDNRKK